MKLKKFENYIAQNTQSDDEPFVIIVNQFPPETIKLKIEDTNDELDKETALIDALIWYRDKFGKEIENEDEIINKLRNLYS